MNFQTLNWTYEPVSQTQKFGTNSRAGCDQFSDMAKSLNKSNSEVEDLPSNSTKNGTAVHERFQDKPAQRLGEMYLF
jgi:hypothetical protein